MRVEKDYYSRGEIAKLFGVSKDTVYRLINEGELKAIKVRNSLRVSRDELDRYIKEHETDTNWDNTGGTN